MTEAPETPKPAQSAPPESAYGSHGRDRAGGSAHRARAAGTHGRSAGTSRGRRAGAGFYADALDPADRDGLADAAAVRGIDQEIAVLRLRLRRLLSEHPEDFVLAVRSLELLVRAVGAAGKLAADDTNDVLDRIYAELGGIVALIAEASEGSGQ